MGEKKSELIRIGQGIKSTTMEMADNIIEFEQETGTFKTIACAAIGSVAGHLVGSYQGAVGGMIIGGAVELAANIFADH
jgi:outer membrane lipoprotein SlyB